MNNEIKEILDAWKNKKYILAYTFNYDSAREQNGKLLDYITNLQQENKDNEQLIETQLRGLEKQKQIIEKAVEYIENDDNFWVALGEDCGKPNDDLDKLLDVLKGEEND